MVTKTAKGAQTSAKATHTGRTGEASDIAEDETEVWGEELEALEAARVHVSLGFTMNTGDYESIRGDVSLTMPCDPEDIDSAYDEAYAWVDDRIGKLHAEAAKFKRPRKR